MELFALHSAHRSVVDLGDRGGAPLSLPAEVPSRLEPESAAAQFGIMKTTVDIPDAELNDVVKFTRAKTKRDADGTMQGYGARATCCVRPPSARGASGPIRIDH